MKIAKTNPGAKSRDLMEDLRALALSHDEHRQFREDVKGFIDLVFDIATDALDEYEQYKKKRGLIDYTDMETYVSRLLRTDTVRETLRGELDLLLVDEFQDTSPIQLDIFLQFSRLAKHSIWVGDPKQSIYGFRGAEPALMQAIIRATGGVKDKNILKKSWRSRPDLVHAVNAIFTRAFSDMPREQVVLEPAFNVDTTFNVAPSLSLIHWHFRSELDEKKVPGQPWLENCIADQISIFLEQKTLIYNKKRTETRPARPCDIAILCRNNKGCRDMADALHRAGLKAAISRAGLLETAEAKLALACLKYLLTPSDSLSVAEILLLTGAMNLEEIIDNRVAYLAEWRQTQTYTGPWGNAGILRQLGELRPRTADLSASEILNLVLDEPDLRRIVVQLGNPAQRLDNLDRLRRYALDYESACQRLHSAASLGGFLLWLNDLARNELDAQGSGESDDAVKVLTYHRSKGLEYPVVVCHNLNQPLKEQIWGINLVAETEEPDLDNILGNRWIRFWVNPYADQLRGTRLEETLLQTPEWAKATRTALDEEARLLYVGLTRARDYLVFPTTAHGTKWLNRVFNHGDENVPTLDPDSDETPFYHNEQVIFCRNEPLYKPKDFPESLPDESPVSFHPPRAGKHPVPRQSLMIDPVQETPPGFEPRYADPVSWAPWLEFSGDFTPDMEKAVFSFLIADDPAAAKEIRRTTAEKQLAIRGAGQTVAPESLLRQSDAWHRFLKSMFQPAAVLGKYPLEGDLTPGATFNAVPGGDATFNVAPGGDATFNVAPGGDATFNVAPGVGPLRARYLRLEVDFFLENEEQVTVLLFARFAEGMKKWRQHVQALAPVLGWSRLLIRKAFPGKSARFWVVFPIEGQAVEVLF